MPPKSKKSMPPKCGQPISRTIFETQRMVENARQRQNAREEARMAETAAARRLIQIATHYKTNKRK